MNRDERDVLYKTHSRMLFPKSEEVVNLDDQISGRQDYIDKFKRSFYIIGNSFFSTNHLGDYNQDEFIRKTGYKSQRYPQKVILALSMLGYITNLFRSYSVVHHSYQYEVDYWKFKQWDKDIFVDVPFDVERETSYEIPDYGNKWLYRTSQTVRFLGGLTSPSTSKEEKTVSSGTMRIIRKSE